MLPVAPLLTKRRAPAQRLDLLHCNAFSRKPRPSRISHPSPQNPSPVDSQFPTRSSTTANAAQPHRFPGFRSSVPEASKAVHAPSSVNVRHQGLMHRTNVCPQSITSSASICIEVGTSMPSALAVFMLMTSSNLVDCWTGRSAGFSPLRILPV